MKTYATQDEQDRAREEWFNTRDKRKQEREKKEERRKEQEAFHREWWGLDEQGRKKLDEGRGKMLGTSSAAPPTSIEKGKS
jgi:COX assembly protein 1